MKKKACLLIAVVTVVVIFGSISCVRAAADTLKDGIYQGEHSFIKVEVTVKGNKIHDIKILHHGGGGKKYADMVAVLTDDIIHKQSVNVDAITGATVSSVNVKNAVNNALEKAAASTDVAP